MNSLPPRRSVRWLSTVECARSIGVSDWWVRERIDTGLLPALAIRTGRRKIYRVLESDWVNFRLHYTGDPRDPRFDRP